MYLPATVSAAVIHCGINDINPTLALEPHDIAHNILQCGSRLRERNPLISVIIAGILPADETFEGRGAKIEQTNAILKKACSVEGFLFIE